MVSLWWQSTPPHSSPAALPPNAGGLSRSRRRAGLVVSLLGVPLITAALLSVRGSLELDSVLLIYLLAVVLVAVVGGLTPALVAALASFLLANWFLTQPYYTFAVEGRDRLVQLVVFVVVAVLVSITVDIGARDRVSAERNRMEARLLSRLTSSEIGAATVDGVLRQIMDLFELPRVELLSPSEDARTTLLAAVGEIDGAAPSITIRTDSDLVLCGYGPQRFAQDSRLLRTLAESAARAWHEQRLAADAARAEQLAATDRVRVALLAAVSHDLRTPTAGIKAAVSTLRQNDVDLTNAEEEELLATIEDSTDRLTTLITNLLAMSRIQAGAVSVHPSPVAVDEVVARAILATGTHDIEMDVPEDLPAVVADPGLLERVVANLITNAVRYSPAGVSPRVQAKAVGVEHVEIDVVDHGPGVPKAHWEEMFVPFQRLGDRDTRSGVGLGLAIARGFAEAMNATLTPSQTPDGGLTMTVSLPVAP
jgi:K+-sensing histidine kinase KdpD